MESDDSSLERQLLAEELKMAGREFEDDSLERHGVKEVSSSSDDSDGASQLQTISNNVKSLTALATREDKPFLKESGYGNHQFQGGTLTNEREVAATGVGRAKGSPASPLGPGTSTLGSSPKIISHRVRRAVDDSSSGEEARARTSVKTSSEADQKIGPLVTSKKRPEGRDNLSQEWEDRSQVKKVEKFIAHETERRVASATSLGGRRTKILGSEAAPNFSADAFVPAEDNLATLSTENVQKRPRADLDSSMSQRENEINSPKLKRSKRETSEKPRVRVEYPDTTTCDQSSSPSSGSQNNGIGMEKAETPSGTRQMILNTVSEQDMLSKSASRTASQGYWAKQSPAMPAAGSAANLWGNAPSDSSDDSLAAAIKQEEELMTAQKVEFEKKEESKSAWGYTVSDSSNDSLMDAVEKEELLLSAQHGKREYEDSSTDSNTGNDAQVKPTGPTTPVDANQQGKNGVEEESRKSSSSEDSLEEALRRDELALSAQQEKLEKEIASKYQESSNESSSVALLAMEQLPGAEQSKIEEEDRSDSVILAQRDATWSNDSKDNSGVAVTSADVGVVAKPRRSALSSREPPKALKKPRQRPTVPPVHGDSRAAGSSASSSFSTPEGATSAGEGRVPESRVGGVGSGGMDDSDGQDETHEDFGAHEVRMRRDRPGGTMFTTSSATPRSTWSPAWRPSDAMSSFYPDPIDDAPRPSMSAQALRLLRKMWPWPPAGSR